MTIGDRIAYRRKELGLTQEELGKRLGVTRSNICKAERDKSDNLTLDKVSDFAKALGVSPAYLMGWETNIVVEETNMVDVQDLNEEQKKQIVTMIAYFKSINERGE